MHISASKLIQVQGSGKIKRETIAGAVGSNDFSALLGTLSPEAQQRISAALSDKHALQMLLQSDEAKAVLKNFLG